MSLKHAILVMLEKESQSGYDLLQQFKKSLGYFWNAKHQQIYLQLKKLHDECLITFENSEQSGKPDKKIYSITKLGRDELFDWLVQPAQSNRINDALLVKIYSATEATSANIMQELNRHISIHKTTLANLKKIENEYLSLDEKEKDSYRFPYITLRRGIIGEEAWLQWADEAIQLFKK